MGLRAERFRSPTPEQLSGSACGATEFNEVPFAFPAIDHNRRAGRTRPRYGLRLATFPIRSLRSLKNAAPEPCCFPGPDAGC